MAINMEGANTRHTFADVARSIKSLADRIGPHKNRALANKVMERNSYEPASTKSDLGTYRSKPKANKSYLDDYSSTRPAEPPSNLGKGYDVNAARERMEKAQNEYSAWKKEDRQEKEEKAKAEAEAEAAAAEEPGLDEIWETYSDENLDGMGLYDFVVVDPYSSEDRQMWKDWVYSPEAYEFYKDVLAEYDGNFDAYYNDMIGLTLEEVLADPMTALDYLPSNELVGTFLDEVAYRGYIPDISGDEGQQAKVYSFLKNNPYAVSLQMRSMWGHNLAAQLANDIMAGEMTQDEAQEILELDEWNYLNELGNARFGYGDEYSGEIKDYDGGDFEMITSIDPEKYEESQERRYTSYPGTGLADFGDTRVLTKIIYGDEVGWTDNPNVDGSGLSASDLWDEYESGENPVGWVYSN